LHPLASLISAFQLRSLARRPSSALQRRRRDRHGRAPLSLSSRWRRLQSCCRLLHPAPQLRVPQTLRTFACHCLATSQLALWFLRLKPAVAVAHYSAHPRVRTTFEEPAAGAARVYEWWIAAGRGTWPLLVLFIIFVCFFAYILLFSLQVCAPAIVLLLTFPHFHLSAFSSLFLVFSPPRTY
jgi:hypothetical protein